MRDLLEKAAIRGDLPLESDSDVYERIRSRNQQIHAKRPPDHEGKARLGNGRRGDQRRRAGHNIRAGLRVPHAHSGRRGLDDRRSGRGFGFVAGGLLGHDGRRCRSGFPGNQFDRLAGGGLSLARGFGLRRPVAGLLGERGLRRRFQIGEAPGPLDLIDQAPQFLFGAGAGQGVVVDPNCSSQGRQAGGIQVAQQPPVERCIAGLPGGSLPGGGGEVGGASGGFLGVKRIV